MRLIATSQDALYARDTVQPIKLVLLTTYTDRDAGTVQSTYDLSDRPVLYPWGAGAVRQFEAMVSNIDAITRGMNHLPSFGSDYAGALGAELRLWLMNVAYRGGDRFYKILRALNLERCDIEIATVLADGSWYDLRSLVGTEHVVHGRGRLSRIEGVSTDAMQLKFETALPTIPWTYALDATITDPKDLGARLPVVYGAAPKVKCINWEVGWQTSLSAPLSADAAAGVAVYFTDPTGFPLTAFLTQIEGERVAIAARNAATDMCVMAGRAQSGTNATLHVAGAIALELPDQVVVVVAGHAISSLDRLYVLNPYNQELFALQTFPAPNLADTVTVPGETVASVTFTQAELIALLGSCSVSAQVTQQPNYSTAAQGSYSYQTVTPVTWFGVGGNGPGRVITGAPTSPEIKIDLATNPNYGVATVTWTQGLSSSRILTRIKIYADVDYDCRNSYGIRASLWTYGISGIPNQEFTVTPPYGQQGTTRIESQWFQYAAAETNLIGAQLWFAMQFNSGYSVVLDNYVRFRNWGIITESYSQPVLTQVTDAKIEASSVGYGLEFWADVSGATVPAVYAPGYGFDDATSWSVEGCTVSADTTNKTEGTGSLKLTAVETVLHDFDTDAASWTPYRCTLANDAADKSRGAGSMKITMTVPNDNCSAVRTFAADDWSGSLIAFDAKLTNPAAWEASGALGNTLGLHLFVSDRTDLTTGHRWSFGKNAGLGLGVWVTIVFDPDVWPKTQTAGTLDLTQVRGVVFLTEATDATLHEWRVDNLRLLPRTMIAQRNATAGTLDLSAAQPTYRLALRGGVSGEVASGEVAWSNTAGSGTTLPAAYRTLAFTGSDLSVGAFSVLEAATADTGSPGVDNVETVRVAVTLNPAPRGVLAGPAVVWVDNLERSAAAEGYSADRGELVEHPADILRHLLTVRCNEPTSVIDETAFTAYVAALGPDAKMGCDLRLFGDNFGQIATVIAYEGRANLVRDEAPTGSTWRPLAAGVAPTYAFGDPVRTLTEWRAPFSESGQDVGELFARTLIYYGYDPSLGSDESAYLAVLQATPEVCDVPGTTTSDLAALEAIHGRREVQRIFLRTITDPDTAKDVGGYYVREARRRKPLWILPSVAWWQAYDLERGDIVALTPPWDSTLRKARVLEPVKSFKTETVDLRVVEVP